MLTLMLKLRKKAEYSVLTSCLDILQCAHTCRNNFAQKNSQSFIISNYREILHRYAKNSTKLYHLFSVFCWTEMLKNS